MEFTTREISVAFWSVLFLGWGLTKKPVRSSVGGVVRAFFQPKLLAWVGMLLLYVGGVVWALSGMGIWSFALVKETAVWFCFAAVVRAGSALTSNQQKENRLSRMLIEGLSVLLVAEFLIATYTFSLPVELLLVPFLTVVAILDVFASHNEAYPPAAKRFLHSVLAFSGFVIFAFSLSAAAADLDNLWKTETAWRILLMPILSVSLVPFIYLSTVYVSYERALIPKKIGQRKPRMLKWYATGRLLAEFGLNARRLREFHRANPFALMRVQTRSDVDSLFARRSLD